MKRKASIATAAVFLAVLFGFSLLHLALPDREVSRSERRRLAQLPPLSSGFSDKLEEYMLDQFPLREQLRTVNSLVRLYGLGQADIHGIYLQGGGAFRMDGPLQEKQVRHAAAVFSAVRETYFPSLPPHYVIVPDKNAKAETPSPAGHGGAARHRARGPARYDGDRHLGPAVRRRLLQNGPPLAAGAAAPRRSGHL